MTRGWVRSTCHTSRNLLDGGSTTTSHPVRDRDIRACDARPSSCARRSGGRVSGSVGWTNTPTFGPNIAPTRSHDGSSVGAGRRADHDQGRVARGDHPQAREPGRQGSGRVVGHPRERVEQALLRDALRRHLRGGELDGEPVAHQQDPERGRRGDHLLEAGCVGLTDGGVPGVDEQDGGRSPGGLVLADHQLAAAGHARPVDPSQVVALDVGPHRVELVAGAEQVLGQREPARHAERRVRSAPEQLDLRRDDELVTLVELDPQLRERERVGQVRGERPEDVAPALVRRDRVADPLPPAGGQRGDHQPRRPAELRREAVLHQEERGLSRGLVLDLELDVHALAGLHARVREASADPQPLPAPAGEQGRGEREQDDPDRDHVQGRRSEHPGGHPEGDPGPEDQDPPARGHVRRSR